MGVWDESAVYAISLVTGRQWAACSSKWLQTFLSDCPYSRLSELQISQEMLSIYGNRKFIPYSQKPAIRQYFYPGKCTQLYSHFPVIFLSAGRSQNVFLPGGIPTLILYTFLSKGKAVPLQAWTGPEGSRKLRFPDFVTTEQDGGRLSTLRIGRLYPQEILLVLISVRG